jgi:hypothetical protein
MTHLNERERESIYIYIILTLHRASVPERTGVYVLFSYDEGALLTVHVKKYMFALYDKLLCITAWPSFQCPSWNIFNRTSVS